MYGYRPYVKAADRNWKFQGEGDEIAPLKEGDIIDLVHAGKSRKFRVASDAFQTTANGWGWDDRTICYRVSVNVESVEKYRGNTISGTLSGLRYAN